MTGDPFGGVTVAESLSAARLFAAEMHASGRIPHWQLAVYEAHKFAEIDDEIARMATR